MFIEQPLALPGLLIKVNHSTAVLQGRSHNSVYVQVRITEVAGHSKEHKLLVVLNNRSY